MSTGFLNNKKQVVLNPFDGGLEIQPDIASGMSTRDQILTSFTIQLGFSRVHPNLTIPLGLQVDVEGELIVL